MAGADWAAGSTVDSPFGHGVGVPPGLVGRFGEAGASGPVAIRGSLIGVLRFGAMVMGVRAS